MTTTSGTRDPRELPNIDAMNVSVLGGTGEQGRGLAQRLARAGQSVMIGSRSADRAQSIAAEIGSGVAGGSNEDAARFGDIVIVAVPWGGHRDLLESLAADLCFGGPAFLLS